MDKVYFLVTAGMRVRILIAWSAMRSPASMANGRIRLNILIQIFFQLNNSTRFFPRKDSPWSYSGNASRIVASVFKSFKTIQDNRYGINFIFRYESKYSAHANFAYDGFE